MFYFFVCFPLQVFVTYFDLLTKLNEILCIIYITPKNRTMALLMDTLKMQHLNTRGRININKQS